MPASGQVHGGTDGAAAPLAPPPPVSALAPPPHPLPGAETRLCFRFVISTRHTVSLGLVGGACVRGGVRKSRAGWRPRAPGPTTRPARCVHRMRPALDSQTWKMPKSAWPKGRGCGPTGAPGKGPQSGHPRVSAARHPSGRPPPGPPPAPVPLKLFTIVYVYVMHVLDALNAGEGGGACRGAGCRLVASKCPPPPHPRRHQKWCPGPPTNAGHAWHYIPSLRMKMGGGVCASTLLARDLPRPAWGRRGHARIRPKRPSNPAQVTPPPPPSRGTRTG